MCHDCDKAALNPFHGAYSRDCVDCAARAVIYTRPLGKVKQEQEIEYFSRNGKFNRADILERVEAMK